MSTLLKYVGVSKPEKTTQTSFPIPLIESPLFALNSDQSIKIREKIQKTGRTLRLLTRSAAMEANIIDEATKVIINSAYEGLVYMVYTKMNGQIIPIYIGITHRLGRSGEINANLNLKNRDFFVRWGDDYARHIGGISNALFHNGFKEELKYQRFADNLVKEENGLLYEKQPLFFGIKAISSELDALETQLIGQYHPIVNTLGVN
jgi:hypothetical protein